MSKSPSNSFSSSIDFANNDLSELKIYQETVKLKFEEIKEQLKIRGIEMDSKTDHTLAARQLSKLISKEMQILNNNYMSQTTLSAPIKTTNEQLFPQLMYVERARVSSVMLTSIPNELLDNINDIASDEWLDDINAVLIRNSKNDSVDVSVNNDIRLSELNTQIRKDVEAKISARKREIFQEYCDYRQIKKEIFDLKIELYGIKSIYMNIFKEQMHTKKKQLKRTMNDYINDQYRILKYKIRNVENSRMSGNPSESFSVFFERIRNQSISNDPFLKNDPYYEQLMTSEELSSSTKDNIYKSLCLYRWKLDKEYKDKLKKHMIREKSM